MDDELGTADGVGAGDVGGIGTTDRSTMRAVQISAPGGAFELVERAIPQPGRNEVRVRVEACGVCHSDTIAKDGLFPGLPYPLVPGHEIAGVIDALGAGVAGFAGRGAIDWTVGMRVGIGWFGGSCGRCEPCRRGELVYCRNLRIPGITCDGGYADYVIAPIDALALMPDDLASADAAPLLCAGVTTYNALRESGARPGDLVAVHGIGGLGHLGVQFAAKMGCRTVAVGRGAEKEAEAKRLGAQVYLDSDACDVAAELQKLGGAAVILATVPSGAAMGPLVGGLGVHGRLMVIGVGADPMQLDTLNVLGNGLAVVGHASGASIDSQDTLAFSAQTGVRAMIETLPLERAAEAYERMISGKARFRMVLTTGEA